MHSPFLKPHFIWITTCLCLAAFAGEKPVRQVTGQTLVSSDLPALKLHVAQNFVYLGSFDFNIRDVAYGTRYVFVEANAQKQVKRLFIAQFEGFLPNNNETYRYDLSAGEMLAGYPFRGNPYAYSTAQARANNPRGEAALTAKFLRERGYACADILRMYRWLTVPDQAKRHELILFYLEPEPDPQQTMAGYYTPDDQLTTWWRREIVELEKRGRKAWRVEPLD